MSVVPGVKCDCGEQHGGQVEFRRFSLPGAVGWALSHVGLPDHDQVPHAHQCRCGVIVGLGVVESERVGLPTKPSPVIEASALTEETSMIVCKTYLTTITSESTAASTENRWANLQAVCRGEENKDWARWTPGGTFKIPLDGTDDTAALLEHTEPGLQGRPEFYVTIGDVGEQCWRFESISFAGVEDGGCKVTFIRGGAGRGEISMTINASGATSVLRALFASALAEGKAAMVGVTVKPAV